MQKKIYTLLLAIPLALFSQSGKTEHTTIYDVQTAPTYSGCIKNTVNEIKIKCLDTSLKKHIQNNFNYKVANCLKQKTVYRKGKGTQKKCIAVLLPGEKRMYLDFQISKTGSIEYISARAPHEKLKAEAIRVGKLIPPMLPAQNNGQAIELHYSIPIDFTIK